MDEQNYTFPSEEPSSDAVTLEDGSTVPAKPAFVHPTPPTPIPSVRPVPPTPIQSMRPTSSAPTQPVQSQGHLYAQQPPYHRGLASQSNPSTFFSPYGTQTGGLIPPRETAQSQFSEHPGGNWTHPIEQAPQSAPVPTTHTKTRSNSNRKLIALLLCFCILLSGASGFVGVLIGQRLAPASGIGGTTVLWETGPSTPVPNGTTDSDALIAAAASARKSVVEITTETIVSGSFFGQSVQSGAGSGVIVTNDGYIVTNHHVIDGASTITVRLENGESYAATPRGTDSETDLAVLKINVTTPLTPAQWGRSEDLKVGQRVFAIGNPLGTLGGSVSDGIISAMDRDITVGGVPMTLMQTNAAVNPGNSGGGLFNLAGQLIGIVNAKYSDESLEGLGFAIPQKIAALVTADLIAQGYVTGRPQLGMTLVNVTANNINQISVNFPSLSPYIANIKRYGLYVYETNDVTLVSGSILMGDWLETVDGKAITSFSDIQAVLRGHKVGDEIIITVRRANVTDPISATIRLTQKTVTVPVS